jgi:hypothetical protein
MEKKVTEMVTLEEEAAQLYDEMDFDKVKKLVTQGRKGWTSSKKEYLTLDSLTDIEIRSCNEDPELGKLMIMKELITQRINNRIDELASNSREGLPYTLMKVGSKLKGVRIDLNDYDLDILRKGCDRNKLELEQDLYNCVGYIRSITKMKTVTSVLSDIEDVLRRSLKKEDLKQVGGD